MDLTPTSHPRIRDPQDPRQGSCPAPYSLLNHLRKHITEAILPHLVPTVPHHLGSSTSWRLFQVRSCRTDRRTYLPAPLGLYLLGLEGVGGKETIVKPPVHPLAVEG
jgi:hypothetical protein